MKEERANSSRRICKGCNKELQDGYKNALCPRKGYEYFFLEYFFAFEVVKARFFVKIGPRWTQNLKNAGMVWIDFDIFEVSVFDFLAIQNR